MYGSYTESRSVTFSITHARHLASKAATDLKRMQRFYGSPSDSAIQTYEDELVVLLKHGYLETVKYGYRRDGKFIEPTLCYAVRDLVEMESSDDDPGKLRPGANTLGASFYTYLTHSADWDRLSAAEREAIENQLPFKRTGAPEPEIDGYQHSDRVYSAGGRALDRSTVRTF